MTCW
jgi:hypothetical protein